MIHPGRILAIKIPAMKQAAMPTGETGMNSADAISGAPLGELHFKAPVIPDPGTKGAPTTGNATQDK